MYIYIYIYIYIHIYIYIYICICTHTYIIHMKNSLQTLMFRCSSCRASTWWCRRARSRYIYKCVRLCVSVSVSVCTFIYNSSILFFGTHFKLSFYVFLVARRRHGGSEGLALASQVYVYIYNTYILPE